MERQALDGVAVFVSETDAIGAEARAQARRLALRSAAAVLGADEREVGIQHEPGGRPYLVGAGLGLHVSITHGRGLAAVALTRLAPVGLDLEVVRAVPTLPLARKWFTGAEGEWIEAQPLERRAAAFFWLWTRKEALGKALGIGLREGGTKRPVGLPAVWRTAGEERLLPEPGADRHCFAMPSSPWQPENVVLALALPGGESDVMGTPVALWTPENTHRSH
ncbi:4'-phosphopantetheinyl transferase family protein [Kitasatospora kazusensis]